MQDHAFRRSILPFLLYQVCNIFSECLHIIDLMFRIGRMSREQVYQNLLNIPEPLLTGSLLDIEKQFGA